MSSTTLKTRLPAQPFTDEWAILHPGDRQAGEAKPSRWTRWWRTENKHREATVVEQVVPFVFMAIYSALASGSRPMTHLDAVASDIRGAVPSDALPNEDTSSLFLLYAVLLLAKGEEVTREDVHNAWVAWMESSGGARVDGSVRGAAARNASRGLALRPGDPKRCPEVDARPVTCALSRCSRTMTSSRTDASSPVSDFR